MSDLQPGQTISPGDSPQPVAEPPAERPVVEQEVVVDLSRAAVPQAATPVAAPPLPTPPAPVDPSPTPPATTPEPAPESSYAPETNTTWAYNADNQDAGPDPTAQAPASAVSWTASEYVAHAKNPGWYVLLVVGLVMAAALVYLLTRDFVAVAMVVIAGVLFGSFSARQPRVLNYVINEQGVQIGRRLFAYHELKSFALIEDGPLPSILLLPLKRFLPPITVFFDPNSATQIVDALSSYLPFEHKQPDAVDRLMSRIRF